MAKKIAVTTVLIKISHLQAEKPDPFLGVEDLIQRVEDDLKKYNYNHQEDQLRDMLYDLEDVIDELLISSVRRRNRAALIQYVSAFVYLPKQLFYVLALVDLLDCYRLRKLLQKFKFEKRKELAPGYVGYYRSWQWGQSAPPFKLNLGSTLISPVISKFEALASHSKLSSSLRKQARWLRDEFTSLQGSLQDVDSRELSEEGMAWIEEFSDVCRSAENVIGLFIDAQQLAHLKKGAVFFKNLAWGPHNFISQHKLAQQMNQIRVKVRHISIRTYNVTRVRTPHLDNFQNLPLHLEQGISVDQLNAAIFEEDIIAINSMLLKDDPRCLTISIIGVGGTGKTSLAKLIFHNKAILDHFPHRYWISGIQQIPNINYQNKYFDNIEASGQYEQYQWKCEKNLRQSTIALLADRQFLIVVDHSNVRALWNSWETSFRNISNGTRIIFIVRQRNEAPPHSDTNLAYCLHLLSHEQSWELFKHSLKMNIPTELEVKLKTNILKKCGGLPKVIVKLGEQLSQSRATLEEWSRVLDNLIQDEGPWSEV